MYYITSSIGNLKGESIRAEVGGLVSEMLLMQLQKPRRTQQQRLMRIKKKHRFSGIEILKRDDSITIINPRNDMHVELSHTILTRNSIPKPNYSNIKVERPQKSHDHLPMIIQCQVPLLQHYIVNDCLRFCGMPLYQPAGRVIDGH